MKGLYKLTEEMGELLQAIGKYHAFPEGQHPDGDGPIIPRMEEELADVLASLNYVVEVNGLNGAAILKRAEMKLKKYNNWGLS